MRIVIFQFGFFFELGRQGILVPYSVKTAIKNKKTGNVFGIVELHLYPDSERREIFEALIPLKGGLKRVPAGYRE